MNKTISLLIRIAIALILVQTLRYKFTAHPDSVFIFSKIGLEPFGRIGIGILELVSAILILIPKTIWIGAVLAVGIISGAIFMHLTKLGIEIHQDNGKLFYMGVIVLILSIVICWNERRNIPVIRTYFK